MRYTLDFGTANAGGAPTFTTYKRLDTLADLAQPTITEIGDGQYYFDVDWSLMAATSITFKATLAGIELSDVISAPSVATSGVVTVGAGASSTAGYHTVGAIVARAGVQCGFLSLNAAQIAAYDPFSSTDPNVLQVLALLDALGMELAGQINHHLRKEWSLTTAASATSYAMPADYAEMVPETGWDRTSKFALGGPASPAVGQFLVAWGGPIVTRIPYQMKGNLITFPVAPSDGLNLAGEYLSTYWIQTAASGTGPDADHATLASDFVLFDPLLVVLGLKKRWQEAKGFDSSITAHDYGERFELAKSRVHAPGVLDLAGRRSTGFRFLDGLNVPDTGYGT